MKPLLVGEMNPYGADPFFALYPLPETSSGGRLQSLILDIPRDAYVEMDRVNLCEGKWSAPAARSRGQELRAFFTPATHKFVLLGAKVSGAFGVPFEPISAKTGHAAGDEHTYVVLPHPSGRNLLWNDPEVIPRVRALLRREFPDLPLGSRSR